MSCKSNFSFTNLLTSFFGNTLLSYWVTTADIMNTNVMFFFTKALFNVFSRPCPTLKTMQYKFSNARKKTCVMKPWKQHNFFKLIWGIFIFFIDYAFFVKFWLYIILPCFRVSNDNKSLKHKSHTLTKKQRGKSKHEKNHHMYVSNTFKVFTILITSLLFLFQAR